MEKERLSCWNVAQAAMDSGSGMFAPVQTSGTHGNAKKKQRHDKPYTKGKSYTELKATTKIRRHTVFPIPSFSLRV